MTTVPNHALRQLRAGKLAIGLGVSQARTVDTATMAKTAGFDWLFIDGEHNSMDGDDAAQLSTAALGAGITPIVRVAGFEHWHASRMLDNGAQGIVFPHVDTKKKRKRVANACRYPPVGKRSMGGALPQLGFASMPVGEAARIVNEETLVVVMIESPQGVANSEEIAADQASTRSSSAPTTCASRWASPASSTTRGEGRLHQGDRRLPQARQVPRHGRHVHARAPRAAHRHGRAAHPERLGLLAADAGRHRARRADPRLREEVAP